MKTKKCFVSCPPFWPNRFYFIFLYTKNDQPCLFVGSSRLQCGLLKLHGSRVLCLRTLLFTSHPQHLPDQHESEREKEVICYFDIVRLNFATQFFRRKLDQDILMFGADLKRHKVGWSFVYSWNSWISRMTNWMKSLKNTNAACRKNWNMTSWIGPLNMRRLLLNKLLKSIAIIPHRSLRKQDRASTNQRAAPRYTSS